MTYRIDLYISVYINTLKFFDIIYIIYIIYDSLKMVIIIEMKKKKIFFLY